MRLLNTFFYLILLGLATSCLSNREQKPQDLTPFEASTIQLVGVPDQGGSDALGFPNQSTFTLKTCFFDKATLEPLNNENFLVEISGKKVPVTVIDPKAGCVSWREVVSFEPLAAERDIAFSRTFISARGKVTLPFSLNPWVSGGDSLTDLRLYPEKKRVDEYKGAHALMGISEFNPKEHLPEKRFSNLMIEDLDGQLINNGKNQRKLAITFKGVLFRKNKSNGETRLIPTAGKVRVLGSLVEINPNTKARTFLTNFEGVEATWKNGRLEADFNFRILKSVDENSELAFVYRVEPIAGAFLIVPIEGERNFGKDRLAKISGAPKEYPCTAQFNPEGMKIAGNAPPSTFVISRNWKVTYLGTEDYDPQAWKAKTKLELELCFKDAFSRTPLVGYPFSILISEKREWVEKSSMPLPPTNDLGCAKWELSVPFAYADEEEILNYFVLVKDEKNKETDSVQSFAIGLNPWQKGALVYRDNEQLGPVKKEKVAPENRGVFIEVDRVDYQAEKRTFEINSHLFLTAIKKYQFSLKPWFRRNLSATGGSVEEKILPKTRFKITGALVQNTEIDGKKDADEYYRENFLAGFETEGEVDTTRTLHFEAAFPIESSHLPKLDSRLKVILKIVPLGEGVLPHATTIAVKFKADPITEEASTSTIKASVSSLVPEELLASKKLRKVPYSSGFSYALKSPFDLSPLQLYEKFWKGFSLLTVVEGGTDKISDTSITYEEFLKQIGAVDSDLNTLKSFFFKGETKKLEDSLKVFCAEIKKSSSVKSDYENCVKEPKQFFHVSSFNLMGAFNKAPAEVVQSKKINLNITASFTAENSDLERETAGQRDSKQFSFSLSGKMGYEHFGNGGSAGVGFSKIKDFYKAVEVSVSDELGKRIMVNELELMGGESKTLEFEVPYRSCVMVRPLGVVETVQPLKSYLFCLDSKNEKIRESWYFLREVALGGGTVFSDDKDPSERPWYKFIRGSRLYDAFRGQMADKTKQRVFELRKASVFKDGLEEIIDPDFSNVALRERLRGDGSVFPGVSDFREFTTLQWIEPEIQDRTQKVAAAYLKKVPQERKGDAKLLSRIYKTSRCYVESIAREMPYAKFLEDPSGVLSSSKMQERESYCQRFAKVEEKK